MGLLPIKPAEVLFSYTGPDTKNYQTQSTTQLSTPSLK
jgi:hypothetical protein